MRFVVPVLIGILGCAILVGLGIWQVQRLGWKEAILAEIEAEIDGPPLALPQVPDPETERYLPVEIDGFTTGAEVHILASLQGRGAVYRVIAPFETSGGRRVLVDLGTIPTGAKMADRPGQEMQIVGNLHWPDETDSFTPAPDREANIWFARDVPALAAALETEPLLIVARRIDPAPPGVTPLPVGVEGIPNDHLHYAITWFSLAAIWLGMTGLLLWRMTRGGAPGAETEDRV